jgi:hypothetical protein
MFKRTTAPVEYFIAFDHTFRSVEPRKRTLCYQQSQYSKHSDPPLKHLFNMALGTEIPAGGTSDRLLLEECETFCWFKGEKCGLGRALSVSKVLSTLGEIWKRMISNAVYETELLTSVTRVPKVATPA